MTFINDFKNKENQNSTKLRGIIGYLKLNDNILNPNDFLTNSFIEYNMFSQNLIGMCSILYLFQLLLVKCFIFIIFN